MFKFRVVLIFKSFIFREYVAYHFRKTFSETLKQSIHLYAFYFDYAYSIMAVWRHKASNMAASMTGGLQIFKLQ